MEADTKNYLRTILSKLDGMSNEVNEILEDEYLQDDEEQMTACWCAAANKAGDGRAVR